ncbi:CPBP family intramembrane glutamic endopeptidase [Fulvivirga lutimaris]|uniref:CPBP family intramembrane glutamic endopeptidase n=1 Tax=Fulvivirga lutimaris TaxID=1819566 RepID=UPI0012BB6A39|nr:CPBP family intramembrane glutamic endopeptidase [Fulvivirga lutimaris]MTI39416.1 CPBP family intramembrane metalloprotease [Fulvivirga lutimaris]
MGENYEKAINTQIGKQLHTNRFFKIGEILLVFLVAFSIICSTKSLVVGNPILKQAIVWIANIFMLIIVCAGLKLRGQSWKDLGLGFSSFSWRYALKIFLLSLLVFVLALIGFIIGSIVMANITGIPESANMSGYDYMKDNLVMLLLTLVGVYIVSSFGEEVIYRAFLINRISELGLSPKYKTTLAIILSSIVFGLVHYEWGPMGIVQTGFMGLALGICYIKFKKRLWILIFAHAYMDTILMVQMYLASN